MTRPAKMVVAHQFPRETHGHYVEPKWVDRVLFEAERFDGPVYDPCCGIGRILFAAQEAGHCAYGTDIVDRGIGANVCDYLEVPTRAENTVMNPPFSLAEQFCELACQFTKRKVACILPTRKLNAAHWLLELPLHRIWYLTPRPSMLPGYLLAKGQKAEGGMQDFCWLVFEQDHIKDLPPKVGWLHRDRGVL